ncbi:hypothetical protein [Streptomyces sp. NPDC085529]|uniref:hypothetical protein n=1 Tax=Streptomyces sp. NPDC085529 TaxID=3365729 RepID=UPI0037CCD092
MAAVTVRPWCEGALSGLGVEDRGGNDGEGNGAELSPDGLGFTAPWVGTYAT